jgi:hypothetical protein
MTCASVDATVTTVRVSVLAVVVEEAEDREWMELRRCPVLVRLHLPQQLDDRRVLDGVLAVECADIHGRLGTAFQHRVLDGERRAVIGGPAVPLDKLTGDVVKDAVQVVEEVASDEAKRRWWWVAKVGDDQVVIRFGITVDASHVWLAIGVLGSSHVQANKLLGPPELVQRIRQVARHDVGRVYAASGPWERLGAVASFARIVRSAPVARAGCRARAAAAATIRP